MDRRVHRPSRISADPAALSAPPTSSSTFSSDFPIILDGQLQRWEDIMTFTPSTYVNFVSEDSAARERLFLEYIGRREDFDIIIVGSGIGGGVLADDLTDRLGSRKRILVLEAGSFLYPTHVYNISRIPNSSLARHFGCDTFWQLGHGGTQNYIGEIPQLNFGADRSFGQD
jgi:hypothetical protein